MKPIDRRTAFKLAGAGTVVAAGAALPIASQGTSNDSSVFSFRATLGLPEPPLPSYATYVVEGSVDLATGMGLLTSRLLAGHPGAPSEIALPGLGRIVRLVGVDQRGSLLDLRGIIEDRSQLQVGESPDVQLTIDREQRIVHAPFGARTVELTLV